MIPMPIAHIWCPQPECGKSAHLHKDHVEYELVHYICTKYLYGANCAYYIYEHAIMNYIHALLFITATLKLV